MKKIILVCFFIFSVTMFGEIKDNVGIFSSDNLKSLEKTIDKIEKKKDIKIYINTVMGKESFQIENPQKTVIIIYQLLGEDLIATELKFTEDLKMSEKSQEVDLILDALKEKMFEKDYTGYTESLLNRLDSLIVKEEDNTEERFLENVREDKKGFFKKIFSKNP